MPEEPEQEQGSTLYVLNTSSKKIHRPDCSGVASMAEHNKQETYETIAVKWDGQIVATKRKKKSNEKVEIEKDLSETEVPDVESMQVKEENPDNLKQE